MADLLTHVLVAYVIGSILAWRYDWFGPSLVTAVMAGALLPDLVKVRLVLPNDAMASLLGIPFSWDPLHQVGGIAVVVAIAVLLVPHAMRGPVLLALSLGSLEHVIFDSFLYWPDGYAFVALWPFTTYQFAVDGFYKSWDVAPLAITLVLVALVLATHWYRRRRADRPEPIRDDPVSEPAPSGPQWPPTPGVAVEGYRDGGVEPGD